LSIELTPNDSNPTGAIKNIFAKNFSKSTIIIIATITKMIVHNMLSTIYYTTIDGILFLDLSIYEKKNVI